MNILGVIPARKGSKRIKDKNIRNCLGKPLIQYAFDAGRKSKELDHLIVSTDSELIIEMALSCNVDAPFLRPDYISNDEALMIDVVKHALEFYEKKNVKYDAVALLQPTSPLRKAVHIDEALKIFRTSKPSSLVSVERVEENKLMQIKDGEYIGFYNSMLTKKNNGPLFKRNGPAILVSKASLIKENNFYGDAVLPYEMDSKYSIDINYEYEFLMAEAILQSEKV
mgnify:CR=1 FL=1|tara:strand:- start:22695 stop:23369 length:675 start_codon:yes stop_codon:yes gene_type:complete